MLGCTDLVGVGDARVVDFRTDRTGCRSGEQAILKLASRHTADIGYRHHVEAPQMALGLLQRRLGEAWELVGRVRPLVAPRLVRVSSLGV